MGVTKTKTVSSKSNSTPGSKSGSVSPKPETRLTSEVSLIKSESSLCTFTADELMLVQTNATRMRNNAIKNQFKYLAKNTSMFMKLSRANYNNSIIPYNLYKKWETIWPSTMQTIAVEQSNLNTIKSSDNEKLILQNFPVVKMLLQATQMMNIQSYINSPFSEILDRSLTLNPGDNDPKDVKVLHGALKQIGVGHHLPNSPIRYEQMFASPWAGNIVDEERHARIIAQIANWSVDHKNPELLVDIAKLYLIINFLVLSTDGVEVEDGHKISKLKDMHLNQLWRYLNYKYNDDSQEHLIQGFMLIHLAREAIQIESQRLPV